MKATSYVLRKMPNYHCHRISLMLTIWEPLLLKLVSKETQPCSLIHSKMRMASGSTAKAIKSVHSFSIFSPIQGVRTLFSTEQTEASHLAQISVSLDSILFAKSQLSLLVSFVFTTLDLRKTPNFVQLYCLIQKQLRMNLKLIVRKMLMKNQRSTTNPRSHSTVQLLQLMKNWKTPSEIESKQLQQLIFLFQSKLESLPDGYVDSLLLPLGKSWGLRILRNLFLTFRQTVRKCVQKANPTPENLPASILGTDCAFGLSSVEDFCSQYAKFIDWFYTGCGHMSTPPSAKTYLEKKLSDRCDEVRSFIP